MKKKILLTFVLGLLLLSTVVYAANGYEFNLSYEGNLVVNEPKNGSVTLTGTEGTVYSNVRVQSEQISGPATPTIYAYDENGNKFDITQTNAWGPTSGFAVGGTFTNKTPITATYPKAGTYVSKLSLVDLNNNNAVITSKEFTVTVYEKDPALVQNNVVENNIVQNNVVTEIPKAGISIWVYLLVIVVAAAVAWAIIYFIKNKKA